MTLVMWGNLVYKVPVMRETEGPEKFNLERRYLMARGTEIPLK